MGSATSFDYSPLMQSIKQVWRKQEWSPEEASWNGERYTGVYRFSDDQQGDRPLLHGPLLSHLVMFHALASSVLAYSERHFPVLDVLPRVGETEIRQRTTIASLQLRLKKPVVGPVVPVSLTMERFVDQWEEQRMIFAALSVDVAGGRHIARMQGCYDFRSHRPLPAARSLDPEFAKSEA